MKGCDEGDSREHRKADPIGGGGPSPSGNGRAELGGVVGWVSCRRCPIPKYVSSATLLAGTYMTVRLSWMIGKYTDNE